jgi:hypothetical protein
MNLKEKSLPLTKTIAHFHCTQFSAVRPDSNNTVRTPWLFNTSISLSDISYRGKRPESGYTENRKWWGEKRPWPISRYYPYTHRQRREPNSLCTCTQPSTTSWGSGGTAPRPGRFTLRERFPGTYCRGGWVGPRDGLDAAVKRKILGSAGNKIPAVQPVAQVTRLTELPSSPSISIYKENRSKRKIACCKHIHRHCTKEWWLFLDLCNDAVSTIEATVSVTLYLCLTKHHAMKTYWGLEV